LILIENSSKVFVEKQGRICKNNVDSGFVKICDGHIKRQGNIFPLNCRTALSKGNLADNTF
jgi:hypothetical protein